MSGPTRGAGPRSTERPATFRDVFAAREYRFLFVADLLSWIGDFLAKAAVAAMVFHATDSVALSAASFALSFLPWIAGGPVLAAVAERRAYRPVMVACDLLRMVLVALVALPGVPIWVMLALLFGTSMLNPPFQAARSALLPQVLSGDRYVVGMSLTKSVAQLAQVVGFAGGAALAGVNPRLALLIDAATFGLSALLIRVGVANHLPIGVPARREHVLRETADGFRLIFRSEVMRAIGVIVVASMFFGIVPEGLAAAWASGLAETRAEAGWMQAAIMVANPIGFIVGGVVIGRFVRPAVRRMLIPVFAVLTPLSLVPALLRPHVFAIAAMAAACGFAIAGMFPAANGLFVQVLPAGYRARAFGVMQSGVQLAQGFAIIATGVLADRFALPTVVGVWSVAGVLLVGAMAVRWPSRSTIDAAVTAATAANGAATATATNGAPTGELAPAPPLRRPTVEPTAGRAGAHV
ncbi:MAG TPA: MFS transporter [Micromonosporaceae bacterium]